MATNPEAEAEVGKVLRSYLGVSFSVFLALLPGNAERQARELWEMKCRRKEESKANARVVEMFASQRSSWRAEQKRLLRQLDAAHHEVHRLKDNISQLERERDQLIGLGLISSSTKVHYEEDDPPHFVPSPSNNPITKQFVARTSPWKVDSDSTGVSSKLKLLEQELLNLETIGGADLSKVPSLMRKQAKRYQSLSAKMDDLCARMSSNPTESALNPEFRTQRQTEFLLEAFRLQQRAAETGQKMADIQSEIGKSYNGDEVSSHAKLTTKRSLDSIRNNLREIQRNLEIWLARMIGDLEGVLARDGASRVREYYMSRYPFVQ